MPSLAELAASGPAPAGERPRLKLAQRSAAPAATSVAPASSSASPFGAARPREETLRAKGVDAAEVDKKIDLKASSSRLTRQQQEEADAVAEDLAAVEAELRRANEMELPENDLRAKAEAKRQELDALLSKFAQLNAERQAAKPAENPAQPRRHFERPSERRKRLEAAAQANQRNAY